jgi:hypothetical protein
MLPAESIFQDIAKLLATSDIRVATALDIRQRKSLTGNSESNISVVALPFPQASKFVVSNITDDPQNILSPRGNNITDNPPHQEPDNTRNLIEDVTAAQLTEQFRKILSIKRMNYLRSRIAMHRCEPSSISRV